MTRNISISLFALITWLCVQPLAAEVFTNPENGLDVNYVLSKAKENAPEAPAGMLITLHGNGGTPGPLVKYTRDLLKKAQVGHDYHVLGVKSHDKGWTPSFQYGSNKDLKNIIALIEHLVAKMPVDRRRIFVWGFSGGGMTSCLLGTQKPEYFHSTASLAGYAFSTPRGRDHWNLSPLFFTSCGLKDASIGGIRKALPQQERAGIHWISHEVYGLGHRYMDPGSAKILQSYFRLGVQRRKTQIAPSAQDVKALREIKAKLRDAEKGLDPSELSVMGRVGGVAVAPLVMSMLKSKHSTLRQQAMSLAALGCHDQSVRKELLKIANQDGNPEQAYEAISILGPLAEWRYPIAEQGLARMLVQNKLSEEHRQNVLKAITDALHLAELGPRRDHKPLWMALQAAATNKDAVALKAQEFLTRVPINPAGKGK